MNQMGADEMRDLLIEMVKKMPAVEDDDLFGFNLDGIQTGEHLLTQEQKLKLITKIRSAETSKAAMRRIFAAVSGALKLAVLML